MKQCARECRIYYHKYKIGATNARQQKKGWKKMGKRLKHIWDRKRANQVWVILLPDSPIQEVMLFTVRSKTRQRTVKIFLNKVEHVKLPATEEKELMYTYLRFQIR